MTADGAAATFTMLEQQVLRLAASGCESPMPVSAPGRLMRRAADAVAARRAGRRLANPRLEALRNHTAALRNGGAPSETALIGAGYTAAQAAAIRALIVAAPRRAAERRDRILYMSGISLSLAAMVSFVGLTGALVLGA